jgi:hypothetical protein
MPNVEFDESQYPQNSTRRIIGNDTSSEGLTGFLIRKGIAKTESGANVLMIICTIIFFSLSFLILTTFVF